MIISRTPYRISFFGGGTDYHVWYQQHGAQVLSTTINHFCYLSARCLAPFFQHQSRIVWSQIEEVLSHEDIAHPAVKAVLKELNINHGVEIHHQGDLPARSGLGSSSSFTVGLLNAMYGMLGMMSTKQELACEAVHIERDVLRENVGVQDQIATAFGGFNLITIHPDGSFYVDPMILPQARLDSLQQHLMLFFTGVSRTASTIACEKIQAIPNKHAELTRMQSMVGEGIDILKSNTNIREFGKLLDESWQLKRGLAKGISPTFVDEIYNTAKKAGAIGGKLLGAGGGGFMLLFAAPEDQPRIREALNDLLLIPFSFENAGSQIVFYDKQAITRTAMLRRDYRHLNTLATQRQSTLPIVETALEAL